MCWPRRDKEPAVKKFIPSDDTAAKREAKHWERER
jgi:hypothetical protein